MQVRNGLAMVLFMVAVAVAAFATQVGGSTSIALGITPTPTADWSQRAAQCVAQREGVPAERLSLAHQAVVAYPLTGQRLWKAKILDGANNKCYVVAINQAGQVVDEETVKEAERVAYARKYGKLEPALYDRLQAQGSTEAKVRVGIWLVDIEHARIAAEVAAKYPQARWLLSGRPGPETDRGLYEQVEKELLAARKQAYALREQPLTEFLNQKGIQVSYASQFAPVVFAELPRDIVLEAARRPEVEIIYLLRGGYRDAVDTAAQTIHAPAVWARGINGASIKVAVVEKGAIDFSNPYLLQANGGTYQPGSTDTKHPTWCAGVIASSHSQYRGIAYGTTLLSANAGSYDPEENVYAASDWAIDQGARVLNCSFGDNTAAGQMGLGDRYYDHVVWHHYRTVVVAAGNENSYVGSPAIAYNVIAVGAIDDVDTSSWSDDSMWWHAANFGSNYIDPVSPHNDREKPEVVAVGARMMTTEDTPYWDRNRTWITRPEDRFDVEHMGTSLAAPQVSGLAALLMQRNPTVMTSWPEVVKAVIMASAWHDVAPGMEYDGAGAVDADLADQIVTNSYFRYTRAISTTFDANRDIYYSLNYLPASERLRVVISWDSHPAATYPYNPDPLESDLDLYIQRYGNGAWRDVPGVRSISYDNSYEIVDFLTSASGQYRIRVHAVRCDWWTKPDGREYIGVAWARKSYPYKAYLPLVLKGYTGTRSTGPLPAPTVAPVGYPPPRGPIPTVPRGGYPPPSGS